jgi:hypothetical protein
MTKIFRKISRNFLFFFIQNCHFLILRQASIKDQTTGEASPKREHPALQRKSGSIERNESGCNPDPDPQH